MHAAEPASGQREGLRLQLCQLKRGDKRITHLCGCARSEFKQNFVPDKSRLALRRYLEIVSTARARLPRRRFGSRGLGSECEL